MTLPISYSVLTPQSSGRVRTSLTLLLKLQGSVCVVLFGFLGWQFYLPVDYHYNTGAPGMKKQDGRLSLVCGVHQVSNQMGWLSSSQSESCQGPLRMSLSLARTFVFPEGRSWVLLGKFFVN